MPTIRTGIWTKEIIEHYNPSGRILDPCRGEGAFYDNFNTDDKDWCELGDTSGIV